MIKRFTDSHTDPNEKGANLVHYWKLHWFTHWPKRESSKPWSWSNYLLIHILSRMREEWILVMIERFTDSHTDWFTHWPMMREEWSLEIHTLTQMREDQISVMIKRVSDSLTDLKEKWISGMIKVFADSHSESIERGVNLKLSPQRFTHRLIHSFKCTLAQMREEWLLVTNERWRTSQVCNTHHLRYTIRRRLINTRQLST